MTEQDYDFDYIVIGSGFGGSVSAMRLAQKGYKVGVLEAGKRYTADTLPKTNWNLRKSFWWPRMSMYGLWRIRLLKNVAILGGAGVGGGSLNYANTLYVPPQAFFDNAKVKDLERERPLLPFYELSKKMLGVVTNPVKTPADEKLLLAAKDMGCDHTYVHTPVAVYFGQEGKRADDPYFLGEGPERIGCNLCGGCMIGCRYDAKNTLDKNYLYFAEKFGARIIPEQTVVDVSPLNQDGSEGYRVTAKKTTGLLGLPKSTYVTKGVVFSTGVLGNLNLLLKLKEENRLPNLSDRLGQEVRTNSEVLMGVKAKRRDINYSRGVAITSSVHPDEHTHIEPVRFSEGSDALSLACTALLEGKTVPIRFLQFFAQFVFHPIRTVNWLNPFGYAYKTVVLLVMQTLDSQIRIRRRRAPYWPFKKVLGSTQEKDSGIPKEIPIAIEFTKALAKHMDGYPGGTINETLLNIPTTAHILGGCACGATPAEGVTDFQNRVHGYENMFVCDGSMIPANLGVNPSLSIVAMSERAMSFVTPKSKGTFKRLKVEKEWNVAALLGGE